jgi:hypothetical protein
MIPAPAKLFVSLLVVSPTPSPTVLSPNAGVNHRLGPAAQSADWTNPIPLASRQPRAEGLTVWYLGHCGFAVQVGVRLLVFDYQEEYGTPAIDGGAGGFADGRIDPEDLVFHVGLYEELWQYSHQVTFLLDDFNPDAFFPTHFGRENEEEKGGDFARAMAERGYDTLIPVPKRRGDRWQLGG